MQRRTFLMGSAGVSLASAWAQTAPVPTAVIGVGNRGYHLLLGVLEEPQAKVAALCDIKPDRLDKAATAAAKQEAKTYTEWRQIIERKDIQAVFIATPPHLHAEMAIAAIRAGKHVYCEKPLGVTASQVRELWKAGRSAKVVFVTGQQLRSMTTYIEAVRKIHDGALGELLWIKAQRHASADLPHDGSSADWYFDVNKSGGYLIEQSVHNLDLCNWIVGAHPVKAAGFGATARYKNDPPGRTIFDCGTLSFEYPNGIKMSFTQNVFHPRGMPGANQYVYVYGSKGAVDLMAGNLFYPLGREGKPEPFVEKRQEAPHAHVSAFYRAILEGGSNPADLKVGVTAALTSILGHEAMVRQAVVKWDDLGVDVS
ncbi:MAG: Gfo/Idh/MocA family oxidoreductase [Bryobacteraceae bacterium]|nr:Gfo/Idh/MocA family oxidoreductase [Bryobacteraceae bacterium]MDW8377779.1 Gfo/Idh/MocA family oxidoreductase [Bryobacterales bacterium]